MILATLSLGGVILGATTIAGMLTAYQIRRATDFENSAKALFAADAGVECALYNHFKGSTCASSLALSNGASYKYTASSISLPDPVGWWTFDEGDGPVAHDSSGNGNDGTLINSPTWTTSGALGGALDLNGTTNYVSIPDAPSLNLTNFTISAWVNPRGIPASAMHTQILSKQAVGRNYGLFFYTGTTRLYATFYYTAVAQVGLITSINSAPLLNTWTHVAVTYDGSWLRIYLNGKLDNSILLTKTPWQSGGDIRLGGGYGTFAYLNGLLDDVRLYNAALSADDVLNLYDKITPAVTIMSEGKSGQAARAFLYSL